MNSIRILSEKDGNFDVAEDQLLHIVDIREKAETGLRMSLFDKHSREEIQIEE